MNDKECMCISIPVPAPSYTPILRNQNLKDLVQMEELDSNEELFQILPKHFICDSKTLKSIY